VGTNSDPPAAARASPAERKVRAGFILALACLTAVGLLFYLSFERLRTNNQWVEHTQEVLIRLERLLSLTADAETAERGYLITADRDYLAAYAAATSAIGQVAAELDELLPDNTLQQQLLEDLERTIADRLARLQAVMNTQAAEGFAAAQKLVQTGAGKHIHDQLREQIAQIADLERSLLRERQQRTARNTAITLSIGAGSSLLALACVAWAALVSRRDLIERRRIEAEREALKANLAEQLDDMRRLHQLSSRLVDMHELPKILEEILAATIELQHADFGNVQLYDPSTRALHIVAQRGFSQAFLDHFRVAAAGDGSVSSRAMASRARVVIEDVEKDPEYSPHRAIAAESGYRGVQSTPIFGRDGSIKGIQSTHFREPHRPPDRALQMTDLYMHFAAGLIERVQDMEHVRLARDEANRANQTKGRFLATASHDLRQPLQTLAMLNGALRRLAMHAPAAEAVAQQEQAIGAMSTLLNALLNISKLESGAIKPQIGNCDLAELARQLRVEFSEPAARKGLRLQIAACHEAALSDPTLLGQILRNLLGNAIRYTATGSVRLDCHREGDRLRIDVADTGVGIAEGELQNIFEEFYQVGVAENTVREGHGLGLSIVQRVARLLNHELRVRSELGKGSVFSVLMPVGTMVAIRTPAREPARSAAAASPRAHVLIVDDDVAVLNATRMLLKVEGYRVTGSFCAEEAMEKARENTDLDLLITDLHLSDGQLGTDVIQSVRSILGRPVKAVLVTGDTSNLVNGIAADSDVRVISKPVRADELLGLVSSMTLVASGGQPRWPKPAGADAHTRSRNGEDLPACDADRPSIPTPRAATSLEPKR